MERAAFASLLDGWLQPAAFTDVAENGLQVQGRANIHEVVCGVSANLALIERALAVGADAIVVHHGLVWGGIRRIDGWLHARIEKLIKNDVNLFAYHLPLDAQPTLGNNAGLARALGLQDTAPFGKYKGQLIGTMGACAPASVDAFVDVLTDQVGPAKAVYGPRKKTVRTVGVCTGGAPDLFHEAIDRKLDAYVTGEDTEWVQAVAEESGCVFIAAGHHATERFGPRALADALSKSGLNAQFIDVENPA
jgi:dinuclear metal center YbgI/SA1388 family protein